MARRVDLGAGAGAATDAGTDDTSAKQFSTSLHLEEEPSFSSGHVYTSTPSKQRASTSAAHSGASYSDVEALRDSDTESIDVDDLDTGLQKATRLHVGRRASAHSTNNNSSIDASNATVKGSRRSGTHSKFGRAPSPSTGSSTLVDDQYQGSRFKGPHILHEHERSKSRIPHARDGAILTEEDGDITPVEEDGTSSSSPRPLRARRTRDLTSYLESKSAIITTPPPAANLRRSLPTLQTPHAPGAFPSVDQGRSLRRSVPEAIQTPGRAHLATAGTGSGTKQIQDAFHRFIHGPDGALAHSAEKRAALAAVLASAAKSASKRASPTSGAEPDTPHPVGYYGFTPTHSVPVEKARAQSQRPPRTMADRRNASASSEDDVVQMRGDVSPSARARIHKSKLEKTLRHIRELQRETEQRHQQTQAYPLQSSPSKPERAADYEGDYSSSAEEIDQDIEPSQAQRSAIKFAMARSFTLPTGASPNSPVQVQPSRASPPRLPMRSSPSKVRRDRQTTPPSPGLPDLPPSPTPESSPARTREMSRPSPHSRQPSWQPSSRNATGSPRRRQPQAKIDRISQDTVTDGPSQVSAKVAPTAAADEPDTTSDDMYALLAELASAVKALQDPTKDENGLLVQARADDSSFTRSMAKRQKSTIVYPRNLQNELDNMDEDARTAMVRREEMLDKLLDAQGAEALLSARIEQLRKSVEQIGSQAADVVRDTLRTESRKRTQWFIIAVLIQLYLFVCMLRRVT
ncbi:hypothetical protein OIV83_003105 [Microbotryomycetes sp. JL201]|nr:hypothetical protein OIV83_003105 [Microbotryomycetes sp. JL201]